MKQNATGKNKNLTYEQRCTILEEIKKETALKDITEKGGKDPTTVSKEVKLHRYLKENKSNKKAEVLMCTQLTCPVYWVHINYSVDLFFM